MKKSKGIIWGVVLILIGIVLGGNALDLFHVDVFFDGWWTLFIIVPCIFGLVSDRDKTGSLVGLVVGILLLLSCQNIIDFDVIWKLIVPIIIVGIGLSLILKNTTDKKEAKAISCDDEVYATFSAQKVNVENEFKGTNLNAIFGGIELDLSKAKIKNDVVINTTAVFGGIDIKVPEDVNVKVKSTCIFGGVDDDDRKVEGEKKKTIYINATCIFGGVDIK